MADPELVADCLRAMIEAVPSDVPVTVKCRIGIDSQDDYGFFERFVAIVAGSGVRVFIVHARKAFSGLSPRENREIPPLRYEVPQRLKQERPDLTVVLNGGLRSVAQAREWLPHFDGMMLGRQVCEDPWLLAHLDATLVPGTTSPTREGVVARYADYVDCRLTEGHRPASLLRHAQTLFTGIRQRPGLAPAPERTHRPRRCGRRCADERPAGPARRGLTGRLNDAARWHGREPERPLYNFSDGSLRQRLR